MGAPKVLLLEMAINVVLDALVGTVPVLGDLFDFVWKANQRNLQLLNSYLDRPRETVVASRLFVWGLVAVLVGLVFSVGLLGFVLLRILIAILLPPLGVFLQVGLGGAFWLNILLTLLGYIPGIVHAVWIIAKR